MKKVINNYLCQKCDRIVSGRRFCKTCIRNSIKKVRNQKIMYHCTKRKNIEKILKEGLKPNTPYGISKGQKGVYLSKYPFDWMHYVTNQTTEAGAMIRVNVENLKLVKDEGINEDDWERHPAYFCPETIPLEKFVGISVSTDDNPTSFEDMKRGGE